MDNQLNLTTRFLTNRDETGRFIVNSSKTGKTYFVEPIGENRSADWGSYNPSTGQIENKKGFDKHRGSIDKNDSMITKENGFDSIHYTAKGASPFSVIEQLESNHEN